MPDLKEIAKTVIDLADKVADYIPGGQYVDAAIAIGRKVDGIIADLGSTIPLEQQADAKAARKKLATAVAAKARATSARMRGE